VLWTYTVITSKRGICTPDVQFSGCCFSLGVRLSVGFGFVLVLVLSFPFYCAFRSTKYCPATMFSNTLIVFYPNLQDVPSHMYESQSYDLLRRE
jgi:hypothetical protein